MIRTNPKSATKKEAPKPAPVEEPVPVAAVKISKTHTAETLTTVLALLNQAGGIKEARVKIQQLIADLSG
jgi:hypothetical protein